MTLNELLREARQLADAKNTISSDELRQYLVRQCEVSPTEWELKIVEDAVRRIRERQDAVSSCDRMDGDGGRDG